MTPPDHRVAPETPRLGPAADHAAAAQHAAAHRDYDRALRERFRAVLRGLEQHGVLKVRRSRTSGEVADEVTIALADPPELRSAANLFDAVVYGGRHATEDEYRSVEQLDRFSTAAPPPQPEPVGTDSDAEAAESSHAARRTRSLPKFLSDPRLWGAIAAITLIALLLYGITQSLDAPTAPPPPPHLPPPDVPSPPPRLPDAGSGSDALWDRLPAPLFFGGAQFLIAGVLVVWWRARRRGALVAEPRPVEAPANELLGGQAALYRRSKDTEHVAALLRAATARRIYRRIGVDSNSPADQITTVIARRTGGNPQAIATALFGPVPDHMALEYVAAHLEWIESEVG